MSGGSDRVVSSVHCAVLLSLNTGCCGNFFLKDRALTADRLQTTPHLSLSTHNNV